MQRRSFLKSATLAGAAGSASLGFASATFAAPPAPRFRVLRAAGAEAGAEYLPLERAACVACDEHTLRVHLRALHLAQGSPLRELQIEALFDLPFERVPFIAWRHSALVPGGGGAPSTLVAGRATLRGLRLRSRHEGEAACRSEDCALTDLASVLLMPGHYVLVAANAPSGLVHSGDPDHPFGADAGFDHFVFRVEATA